MANNDDEKRIDEALAALISQADQMVATFRSLAEGMTVFHRELVEKGMNEEQAMILTITNLTSFWQYLAISHNTDKETD